MEDVLNHPSVVRVQSVLQKNGMPSRIVVLQDSARSAVEAAAALGIEVGQVASSIVFKLPTGAPLLVITSGRHRVDTELVAHSLGVAKLHRADAEYVKAVSGFAIGGVSPLGWLVAESTGGVSPVGWISNEAMVLVDAALEDYEVVWAAAGHPHAVFSTTFASLKAMTNAEAMIVGN